MSSNEKIYVAFDAVNDMASYNLLLDFKKQDGSIFAFYNGAKYAKELDKVSDDILKASIQGNMDDADIVLILLSKTVKSMRRFVKWQIEYALSKNKPVIVMNNSKIRGMDLDITPTILKNHLSLFIPFEEKALEVACTYWPKSFKEHRSNGEKTPYRYEYEVYKQIYSEEEND